MKLKGGRLELLVPHLLSSQVLRPGLVRLGLRLGAARCMPGWAKLQFLNCGVSAADLDRVLRRVKSLRSWVDAWQELGREQEAAARCALDAGRLDEARAAFLAASASFNFAQFVVFLDLERKRALHEACVSAYAGAAPLLDPPARPFEVPFRRRTIRGYLRVPAAPPPVPVVVLFNGTNAVKEELHWWTEALLARGLATISFDGPGLGETFPRLSMVGEPRPVGMAIVNEIQSRPELDLEALGFYGQSLGGYLALRMAAHDPRIKAVAAVSPPYSAEVYWDVTLSGMRRELAATYGMDEAEMGREIHRITLAGSLPRLRCALMITGGGHDLITPGEEAWRVFENARCERDLIYYPQAGHDCFNVLGDLRPRIAGWFTRKLAAHGRRRLHPAAALAAEDEALWAAAEAVDSDFAEALCGEYAPLAWHRPEAPATPARWRSLFDPPAHERVEVVVRHASAVA